MTLRRLSVCMVAVMATLLPLTISAEVHNPPPRVISTNCEACQWTMYGGGVIVLVSCVSSPGSGQSDCWTHSQGCGFTNGCSTVYGGDDPIGSSHERGDRFENDGALLVAAVFSE